MGLCLDSGGERSVYGCHQAVAFCRNISIDLNLKPAPVRFRFGKGADLSPGKLGLRIPLPNGTVLLFHADVVKADILVLMGRDVMKQCGLIMDFDRDEQRSLSPTWTLKIVYQL